jgi:acetaldehyde dehydrogenase / alcohol dehydrogenase
VLVKAIDELKKKIAIPNSVEEFGTSEEKFYVSIDEMVEQAFDDQCTGANPRYPLMSEIRQMYISSYS